MTKTVLTTTSLKFDGQEAIEKCLTVVGPLMERAGAELISRHEVSENLSGSELPQFVSVIEYPNVDAIQMVFNNPDYISLKPVREMAFSRYDVCVLE